MKGRIDNDEFHRKGSKNMTSTVKKIDKNTSLPSHSLRLQLLIIISLIVILVIGWAVYLYGFEKNDENLPQNSILDYLLKKFVAGQRSMLEFLEARINVDIDKDGLVGESSSSAKIIEINTDDQVLKTVQEINDQVVNTVQEAPNDEL